MDFIKLKLEHLIPEPSCSSHDRFSDPAFTRKLPKGIIPCDYDKAERLIEVEFEDGHRNWIELKVFFGKVIGEVKDIFILHPEGWTEDMSIVGFSIFKKKRTTYWKVIFERDLPF
jgi:hypothetical protein